MPTLQFKGKAIIWNHHLSIPYHTIEPVPANSFQPDLSGGNQIIEGDNLTALKALMPLFAGRVNCIYIDPPYNTGMEGWVYNDNVNSPLLQEWLGREVGKDDLTRHDKWLCMMTPRLRLLRDLLSDDGAIAISIDENELHHLKQLMDEIFGETNFRNIIIVRKGVKSVQAQFETVDRLNYGIEYVLIYTKRDTFRFKRFEIELENGREGSWNNHWRGTDRPTMRYELFGITPETGQWRWGQARSIVALENYEQMLVDIGKPVDEVTQADIDNWFMKQIEETGEEPDLLRLSANGKPEHYIPPSDSRLASSHWSDLKPNGSSQLKALFGCKVFENPKSVDLVKRIIRFIEGDRKDTLVLDSFAGSGTTGQAVLDLNSEDAGNRHFILVQLTEATSTVPDKNICRDITRERIVRAIRKYKFTAGFQYQRVGVSMDADNLLSGKLPEINQLSRYIVYLCTGQSINNDAEAINKHLYFAGSVAEANIYILYDPDYEQLIRMALNLDIANILIEHGKGKKKIVYAPACFLDDDYLQSHQLEFVNIPYGLFGRE